MKRRCWLMQPNATTGLPLPVAADTADVPLMKLLLELGADSLIPNVDGCTPLMAAAGIGTLFPGEEAGTEAEALEAVKLCFELGGDVNTVDDNGETAMHGAAYASFPKVVAWLAEHGAKEEIWNRKNRWGWTPLLIAEGNRDGNFKPSYETIDAVKKIMSPEAIAAHDANRNQSTTTAHSCLIMGAMPTARRGHDMIDKHGHSKQWPRHPSVSRNGQR
jgi:ankyrin repeat protein